jgi:hypothetical protein
MNLKVGDRVELSTIGKSRFHDLCNGTVTDICHENNKYDCINANYLWHRNRC